MFRFTVAFWLMLVANTSQATILYFMPGDAFFHTRFRQEVADAIPADGGTITLPYTGPDHYMGGLGGYAGFDKLEIRNVSAELANALKLFQKMNGPRYEIQIGQDGKETVRMEINSPRLFVYVKEFNPQIHHFGLKYNENWNNPPREAMQADESNNQFFGQKLKIPAVVYACFVKGEAAVIADWKDGPKVPPLPVSIPPQAAWGLTGKRISQPVIVNAEDVRFFVLYEGDLQGCFKRKRYVRFFEISASGCVVYEYGKRQQLNTANIVIDDIKRAFDDKLFPEPELLPETISAPLERAEPATAADPGRSK